MAEKPEQDGRLALSRPDLALNLTADRWYLPAGGLSQCIGRDVIHAGRLASEGGRRPIGSSLPDGNGPVSSADAARMYGRTAIRYRAAYNATDYTGTTTSMQRMASPYAWPAEMVGAYIIKNADWRQGDYEIRKIAGRSTTAQQNDTIDWTAAFSDAWATSDKFYIVYQISGDKRGVWLSDGRKIWLLQGGTVTLHLDLGSDDYLHQRWQACQIAPHMVMFVSPKYPSRIVHLNAEAATGPTGNESLAGLIAPVKPPHIEDPPNDGNASWLGKTLVRKQSVVYIENGDWTKLTRLITKANAFTDYTWQQGDLWITTDPYIAYNLPVPVVRILQKVDASNIKLGIEINPGDLAGNVDGFVIRREGYLEGDYYIKVRAVNLDDGAESQFVTVYNSEDATRDNVQAFAYGAITVFNALNTVDQAPPPLHERWTHIEIWRTPACPQLIALRAGTYGWNDGDNSSSITGFREDGTGAFGAYTFAEGDMFEIVEPDTHAGSYAVKSKHAADAILLHDVVASGTAAQRTVYGYLRRADMPVDPGQYYLERRIEISSLDNEDASGDGIADILVQETGIGDNQHTCAMSDAALVGQTQATAADLIGGKPPPICRQAVSLFGVTICAGTADDDAEDVTAYSRSVYGEGIDYDETGHGDGEHALGTAAGGLFANYTFVDGDQFVVTAPSGAAGIYDISAKGSNDTVLLTDGLGGDEAATVYGYLRRPYQIEWPKIESDEDIHYSRTDKFAPESFTGATLSLSKRGDRFAGMCRAGNYAAVIMAEGVHLLYLSGTSVYRDTVAANGQGTPWPASVCATENLVFWATAHGPNVMVVSSEADEDGHRGRIGPLDGQTRPMRGWFEQAYADGDGMDAAVDTHHQCVRFRRAMSGGRYQIAQYSMQTKLWTLLDDDAGLAYAPSSYAEAAVADDSLLYSVTEAGNLFEVNYYGIDHPYDGKSLEHTLDGSYEFAPTWIRKKGAFLASMAGEVLRVISDDPAKDDLARVITAATPDRIDFGLISNLAAGDCVVIGAVRFELRWAPIAAGDPTSLVRVEGLTVRALPGRRAQANADWPTAPSCNLTTALYADYGEQALDRDDRVKVLPIELESSAEDRVSSVAGEGHALEVELISRHARMDFALELLAADVTETAERGSIREGAD